MFTARWESLKVGTVESLILAQWVGGHYKKFWLSINVYPSVVIQMPQASMVLDFTLSIIDS